MVLSRDGVFPRTRGRAAIVALAAFLAAIVAISTVPAQADVSGHVYVQATTTPIAGATVHIRTDQGASATTTAADGSFTVVTGGLDPVELAANVPYDRANSVNYLIAGRVFADGTTNGVIELPVLPTGTNPNYNPPTAELCGSCHSTIHSQWVTAHHAGTATNAWVRDLYSGDGTAGGTNGYVFRQNHAPNETGFCATCHAPMADVFNPGGVYLNEVTGDSALQGVNCVTCHQIDSVDPNHLNALNILGKTTYRFPPNNPFPTFLYVWGPLDDVTFAGMRASHSRLHDDSLLCAACHQYDNPTTGAPGQHTYTEWEASPYGQPGPNFISCQDCHMPAPTQPGANCPFVAADRDGGERRMHTFLSSSAEFLQQNLSLTADAAELPDGVVRVTASVDNFGAGHNFPTGIAIRNALLIVTASTNGEELRQAAGPSIPFWGSDDVPGVQDGDYAGFPGKGFAKVLEGRIDGQGPLVRPVLFIDATGVYSDTTIPSGETDTSVIDLKLPPGTPPGSHVTIQARLLYRRAWRALQVTKGWTVTAHGDPIEIEVARQDLALDVTHGVAPFEIPALGTAGIAILALLTALAALITLRSR